MRPWQFFVLAALACATAVTWLARAQGLTAVIMLSLLMGAVAFAALTTLRTISPLVSPEEDRTVMLGGRTRAAFEREKLLTLRAIKELDRHQYGGRNLTVNEAKPMAPRGNNGGGGGFGGKRRESRW